MIIQDILQFLHKYTHFQCAIVTEITIITKILLGVEALKHNFIQHTFTQERWYCVKATVSPFYVLLLTQTLHKKHIPKDSLFFI